MSRHIVLNGFMAAGKSTVGPLVAGHLGIAFVDLDDLIVERSGKTVAQIFDEDGEATFRRLETEALHSAVSGTASVIAIGGGALQDPTNRTLAEENALIVTLTCSMDETIRRMEEDGPELRPFVARASRAGHGLQAEIAVLLAERSPVYDLYPCVDTELCPPPEAAQRIHHIADSTRGCVGAAYLLPFPSGSQSLISFSSVTDSRSWQLLEGRAALVTDTNVEKLHAHAVETAMRGAGLDVFRITIPTGEASKNMETYQRVLTELQEARLDRTSTIVALGGGVVCDLAGFAASTYLRGIRLELVPTTLLAQVDASIGGKTGVDLGGVKNSVGTFHPATRILIDMDLLKSLPELEVRQGLAEALKVAFVHDAGMVYELEALENARQLAQSERLIRRAIWNKLEIVHADPYERAGQRALLNFGHTVGHAIESRSDFTVPHGDCVAIGAVAEARISRQLDLTGEDVVERLVRDLHRFGLPTEMPDIPLEELLETMQYDKKAAKGTIRMVMIGNVGAASLRAVPGDDLRRLLRELPGVVT